MLLFAFAPPPLATVGLEVRVKRFLEVEPTTESLDAPEFDQINGAETKADYLLARRRFVAELKTLNGAPLGRVEQRMQRRFAQPDAPIVFGQMGMGAVLENLPDQTKILEVIQDLSGRNVRSNLKKSSEQIAAIKKRLSLPNAAGATILVNEFEEMIDAANIAYSIGKGFREHPESYAHIDYVWASIESVFVRMPDGRNGFPQVLISKIHQPPANEMGFLLRMIEAWARSNNALISPIDHHGNWDALQPIYKGAPPTMSLV